MRRLSGLLLFVLALSICPAAWAEQFCLSREQFDAQFGPQLAHLNNSTLELVDNNLRVYLKDGSGDGQGNIGVFSPQYLFPGCSYTVKAEVMIPAKTRFKNYPKIVVFSKGWNVVAQELWEKSFKPNKWSELEFQFRLKGDDIQRLHVAVHGQLDLSNRKSGREFFIRKFEIYQDDELSPPVRADKKESAGSELFCFDEDFGGNQGLTLAVLHNVALNYGGFCSNYSVCNKPVNRYLHKINPALKIYKYFNSEILYKDSPYFKYAAQVHPDWIMRDKDGGYVEEAKYPGNRIMDVTNPDYRHWISGIIADALSSAEFDGVFLDMVCAYYYPAYYTAGLVSNLNGEIDSDKWRGGFIELVRLIRAKGVKLIIGNGIGLYNGEQYFSVKEAADSLANELDGVMIEEFAVTSGSGTPALKEYADLLKDIRMLNWLVKKDKIVWVSSPAARGAWGQGPLGECYMAGFLLGADNKSAIHFYNSRIDEYMLEVNKLGEPAGEFKELPGGKSISREFNNGRVDVDLSGQTPRVSIAYKEDINGK